MGMNADKTISVGTFEAKNKLSALVDMASKGGRIWITKRGKRVAMLSSGKERASMAPGDVVSTFRRIRNRSLAGPETLKSLIEEGRR